MKVPNKVMLKKSFYFICDRSHHDTLTHFDPEKLHKTDWDRTSELIKMSYALAYLYNKNLIDFETLYHSHSMSGFHRIETREEAQKVIDALTEYYQKNDLPIGDWDIGEVKKIGWWKYFVISPELEWAYK